MVEKLKTILRITWIIVGILLIALIIFTGASVDLVCKDIRQVTSKMTVDDARQFLNIIENQQKIELSKDGK